MNRHLHANATMTFLRRLKMKAPMKIEKLLTDNGSQFTDCFTSKNKAPSDQRHG